MGLGIVDVFKSLGRRGRLVDWLTVIGLFLIGENQIRRSTKDLASLHLAPRSTGGLASLAEPTHQYITQQRMLSDLKQGYGVQEDTVPSW